VAVHDDCRCSGQLSVSRDDVQALSPQTHVTSGVFFPPPFLSALA
jgi:hypothetical protein